MNERNKLASFCVIHIYMHIVYMEKIASMTLILNTCMDEQNM